MHDVQAPPGVAGYDVLRVQACTDANIIYEDMQAFMFGGHPQSIGVARDDLITRPAGRLTAGSWVGSDDALGTLTNWLKACS